MLEEYLIEDCRIITPRRNEYGDYVLDSYVNEKCRFRYISVIRRGSNQELNDSDALIHLSKDSVASEDKIVYFEGVYFQIERLYKPKRLGESEVQFIKGDLKILDIGIS